MIPDQQRNAFIQQCLSEGMSLSQVQDQLMQQFGLHMTYMELRMLTAELQVDWEKQDAKAEATRASILPKEAKAKAAAQQAAAAPRAATPMPEEDALPREEEYPPYPEEEDTTAAAQEATPGASATNAPASDALRGATTVEISKVVRPGASLSGTVKFGSGASGEWYVDAYGRLGFNPDEGSSNPDQQDIQEFQVELQKALGY